ncbi:MAG: response regulator transcription factor [Myxococcota bacterium]
MGRHILVVDDEPRIREVVEYALVRDGFDVRCAADGEQGLKLFHEGPCDLVVLDVMLPERGGLDVCRTIRQSGDPTPILFLSARGEEIDRVLGLELGGDDYLTKPFSPRELVARVRAILRRTGGRPPLAEPSRLIHGAIAVELERHEVTVEGELVSFTATERGILVALLERPGHVLTRGQLMERAYAYDNLITERTIDTHVRRIRAKCRPFGVDPIATVYGVGYRIAD